MEKVLYIIPGWEETCRRKPYQEIGKIAQKKGYSVVYVSVDWSIPLSKQVFLVENKAVIFGFSLGAILAWLIAQDYICNHVILASMAPHSSLRDKNTKKAFIDIVGKPFFTDISKHLQGTHKAKKQTILYGDKEEASGDILVKNTEHELTHNYIQVIQKLL